MNLMRVFQVIDPTIMLIYLSVEMKIGLITNDDFCRQNDYLHHTTLKTNWRFVNIVNDKSILPLGLTKSSKNENVSPSSKIHCRRLLQMCNH